MRITNSMMINRVVSNLNNGLSKLNQYNNQLSTNRKMIQLSDDPVGVLSSMSARQNLNKISRYQESVTTATKWVDQSETALMDIENVLITIYENVVDACSIENAEDKYNIGTYIQQLEDHIMQSFNSTVGDKYLFAGYNTTNAPFTRDANGDMLYNGMNLTNPDQAVLAAELSQNMTFEIGYNVMMEVSFTGVEIVGTGDENLFQVLDDLVDALQSGASNEELNQNFIDKVQKLRSNVTNFIVEIGGRTNKLELMENRYSADYINYEAIRTDVEEIDTAETIMNMKMSETVYQQALAVGARIIQPTLMDFLN